MNEQDERAQEECEQERMTVEMEILHRIARGTTTLDDALYVAVSFGLTKEFKQENEYEMGK